MALAQCQVILGTLRLTATRVHSEQDYIDAFQRVTSIQGDLIITGLANIVTLNFLSNLRQVDNVVLESNRNLVDARLASLVTYGTVVVTDCPRLCPDLRPGANVSLSPPTGCGLIRESLYFSLTPTSPLSDNAKIAIDFMNMVAPIVTLSCNGKVCD